MLKIGEIAMYIKKNISSPFIPICSLLIFLTSATSNPLKKPTTVPVSDINKVTALPDRN